MTHRPGNPAMEQRPTFRFDGCAFDPATGELDRGGRRVRLEPQPAKVLALLAERAGELVGHEELRRHLWGDETYVDFERGLRYCVGQVRSALGDAADAPRFVETLPRRGYRFLPPVEVVTRRGPDVGPLEPPPAGEPGAVAAGNVPAPASAARRRLVLGAALAVAALIGLTVALALTRGAGRGAGAGALRLAVVPFDNETGVPAHDALARGLSDAAVARLAAIDPERLAVIGNAAALFRPRSRRDLTEIGRQLDVQYVVLGQVQRGTTGVRVLVHLIRITDQAHLWATRIDRDTPDPLAMEAAVAAEVASAVESRLLAGSPGAVRP